MTHSSHMGTEGQFLSKVAFHFGTDVEACCRRLLHAASPDKPADQKGILQTAIRECFGQEIAAADELEAEHCNSD